MIFSSFVAVLLALIVLYGPAIVNVDHHASTHTHFSRMSQPSGALAPLTHGQLHYTLDTRAGDSAPLVLVLHGISISSYSMQPFASALAHGGARVLTMDFYGRGQSASVDVVHDTDFYVSQVRELLDHLQIESAHLAALSMGGAVAVAFAAAEPARVRSISLLAPAGVPFELPVAGKLLQVEPLGRTILRSPLGKLLMLARVRPSFAEPHNHEEWMQNLEEELAFHHSKPGFAHSFASTVANMEALRDATAQYADVGKHHEHCFCVFWGKLDGTVPYSPGSDVVRQLVPHAQMHIFENTGHSLIFERHDVIVSNVLDCVLNDVKKPGQLFEHP
eukprot:TRINITY_DN1346_c0_g1_i1.p1 TRINITY_DN1346_c0_g1~~TRINITY_DN1346_c0_g1_i1.p1  ORF type:complete len:348 (-),score=147.77 TRINITY_DN1346_c0_g1_i1:66-1064(-)